MTMPNAMIMNGVRAGNIISLPDPLPKKVVIPVIIFLCEHRLEMSDPTVMVEYDVYPSDNPAIPHKLITENTTATDYYCMKCKAESEAKYKLRELRDKMNEYLDEDEDE